MTTAWYFSGSPRVSCRWAFSPPAKRVSSTRISTGRSPCQIVLCSDGLTEAENAAGQAFGRRAGAGLAPHPAGRTGERPPTPLTAHLGRQPAGDDVSVLILDCALEGESRLAEVAGRAGAGAWAHSPFAGFGAGRWRISCFTMTVPFPPVAPHASAGSRSSRERASDVCAALALAGHQVTAVLSSALELCLRKCLPQSRRDLHPGRFAQSGHPRTLSLPRTATARARCCCAQDTDSRPIRRAVKAGVVVLCGRFGARQRASLVEVAIAPVRGLPDLRAEDDATPGSPLSLSLYRPDHHRGAC